MLKFHSRRKRTTPGAIIYNRKSEYFSKLALEKKHKAKYEKTLQILGQLCAPKNITTVPQSLTSCNSLNDLGLFYGTDKSSLLHDLCGIYEKCLEKFKYQPINLFEFGCLNMASLNMWGRYFKNAHIFGVDPAYEADSGKILQTNVTFLSHDAFDADYMRKIFRLHPPAVIIDDATHYYSHQIKGFENYFPLLTPGGVYIMEDMQTSFGPFQEGIWNDQAQNPSQYFASLALAVCGKGLFHMLVPKITPHWLSIIESIEFVKDAVIIGKK